MATSSRREARDIVVIGASAGGVEALTELTGSLPRGLAAAVFVVLHTAPSAPGELLLELLSQGGMRAAYPLHGDEILSGRIYVAPPDNHLLVRRGYVQVVRGPKENGHRPSVDALFL